MEKIVVAKGIKKSYIKNKSIRTVVLKGIDLEIYRGEILCIMGPSGVGKSTLLYVLSSLEEPDEGVVTYYLNEEIYEIHKQKPDEIANLRNRKIGFVFQFHYLLPEFDALENVAMPLIIRGIKSKEAQKQAKEMLGIVGLNNRLNHRPYELSGGEQQRVAIARALVTHPAIVFADEPTGNLDTNSAKTFLDLIVDLKEKFRTTFVIATHSLEVASYATRIAKMKDGLIVEIIS
ncbi:MAG: ABC transporter ATP-binding protein [Ignavibacteria bacterium]|nr:ABC transporter ATP-binding protein [Ignavibacteria bacterium]